MTALGDMSMEKLAAVEMILGGAIPTFNTQEEHEKATKDYKTKAKKLFGDARERADAKEKEKQKGKMGAKEYFLHCRNKSNQSLNHLIGQSAATILTAMS